MTSETKSRKQLPAITSDQWHVIRAWRRETEQDRRPFERQIVSEHANRALAEATAKSLRAEKAASPAGRAEECVFVRKPNYKTLKYAKIIVPKH